MFKRGAVVLLLALASACGGPTAPTDPRLPPPVFPAQALVQLTATPNPAAAGTTVDISMTLTMSDGSSPPLYWNSTFGVFGGPPSAVPPGAISPTSGGPVSPGTTVHVTFVTASPVEAVFSVFPSMQPVLAGVVPQDGRSNSIILHVQ